MAEHVHEWVWELRDFDYWFFCKECNKSAEIEYIAKRLNATERLSDAIGEYLKWVHSTSDKKDIALRDMEKAYADTLDGK